MARRLVDSQFPQGADLEIELTVRLPSGSWYARQVEKEQRWLPVLAPRLPLPIPTPVAKGEPALGFPYAWSVYRWLDGTIASRERIWDVSAFGVDEGTWARGRGWAL
jgi:aminoglycoside phosphotransferase (APT) family kinase protein